MIYANSASGEVIEDTFLNGANVYIKKPAHLTLLKKNNRFLLLTGNTTPQCLTGIIIYCSGYFKKCIYVLPVIPGKICLT